MDIVHIKVVFEDQFSGAKNTKIVTRSAPTFEKMKAGIGSVLERFENNIRWQWKVISVEQAKPEDYETIPG
jgi:hypothetical protein